MNDNSKLSKKGLSKNELIGLSKNELVGEIRNLQKRVEELERASGEWTVEQRQIRRFLPDVVSNIPAMIFIKRASDLSFVLINKAGEELLGIEEEELLGKTDYDFFPEDEAEFFTEKDREVLETGVLRDIWEEPITTPNGIRWLHTKKVPLYDEEGKPAFLVGISEDITEKKQVQDELKSIHADLEKRVWARTAELEEEKERLSVTLRAIGEGVIVTDTRMRVTLTNKAAQSILGWSEAMAIGKPLNVVFQLLRENGKEELPIPQLLSPPSQSLRNQISLVKRDRTTCPIHYTAAPIQDASKQTSGYIVVFREMSREIQAEQELLRAQKLESVGELAGGIAHDFNNLLAAIMGNISLAHLEAVESGDTHSQELMETAEAACLRAKSLTDQLLTFSKGGAPVKQPVDICELIDEASRLALGGSSVSFELDEGDFETVAEADPGQLVQVFNNLLINAKQAMPNGGKVHVSCSQISTSELTQTTLEEGEYIRIIVSDEGCGIPRENLERIFDPYFTTKTRGTGLGLATTYSIINQHGGTIEIKSTPGFGTSITLYLPACSSAIQKPAVMESESPTMGRGRVLLMDDDEIIQDTTGRMIEALGYEVSYAWDGEEAIDLFKEAKRRGNPYLMVILDLTIKGGLGGKETSEQLLKIDPEAKLIVSSGYSTSAISGQYEKFGFKGSLAKPYNLQDLSEILSEIGSTNEGIASPSQSHQSAMEEDSVPKEASLEEKPSDEEVIGIDEPGRRHLH